MAGNKSSGNAEKRTRNWVFILYEDSAPENWRELIDELHIQWVESPWHDKDVNATGEPKKKHKHICLCYDGVKTFDQVKEVTDMLHSPIPKRCQSLKGSIRYFAHLDNPEKAQYKVEDIIAHGGFDLAEMFRPTSSERYTYIKEMIAFVKDNGITEFQDLMDYAAAERTDDWFPLLCDSCAYVVGQYIKSQRHRNAPDR